MSYAAAAGALAVACAIAFAGGWRVHAWKTDSEQAEARNADAESVRLKGAALLKANERNGHEITDRLRAAETAALDARNDLERVRNASAVVAAADPGTAGCPDDGRLERVAGLLAEGASLVEEGGRRVDRLAAEKAGLQQDAAELRRVLVMGLASK